MSSNETVLFCIDTRCKGKRIIHKEVKQKLSEGQSAEFSFKIGRLKMKLYIKV